MMMMMVLEHVFALESFSYINKYYRTEILAFCYWHNQLVIGLSVEQIRGNRTRNFKSPNTLTQLLPELYSSAQSYYYHISQTIHNKQREKKR